MAQFLLVAHAPLASALKAVAGHVFAESLPRIHALDVPECWSIEQSEGAVRAALSTMGDGAVLVLSDVFGATPANAAQRVADGIRVRVVTGVNVPMLWRVLCYADESLEALVARAVSGGAQGVMQVAAQRPQIQSSFARNHDPAHAHHQQ